MDQNRCNVWRKRGCHMKGNFDSSTIKWCYVLCETHTTLPQVKLQAEIKLTSCAAKWVRIYYLRKKRYLADISQGIILCQQINSPARDNWVMRNLFSHIICEYSHRNGFLIKLNCVWISTVSVWIRHLILFLWREDSEDLVSVTQGLCSC